MNVISRYYKVLHDKYGPDLFSAPPVTQAEPGWKEVLLCCQQMDQQIPVRFIGRVHVQSRAPVKVPESSMVLVPATAPRSKSFLCVTVSLISFNRKWSNLCASG